MRSYSGLRRSVGTKGALAYLRDYHNSRVHPGMSWGDAVGLLESHGHDEKDVAQHARFMDDMGADLWKYRHMSQRD